MRKQVFKMRFNTSKFYCKYVIDIINNNIKKLKKKTDSYKELDIKLYESYLKLEQIIDVELKNL